MKFGNFENHSNPEVKSSIEKAKSFLDKRLDIDEEKICGSYNKFNQNN